MPLSPSIGQGGICFGLKLADSVAGSLQCNGFQIERLNMLKQARQHLQNNRRSVMWLDRTTVVQQQYVAGCKAALQPLQNRLCRFCKGIVTAPSPVGVAQARALNHRGEEGVAEAHRRAKEYRGNARGCVDCSLG